MKNFKNNKGITLVSLVITIIVLIVLAAVSINLTIGTDGIITRAKEAAENMEIAAEEEQEMLNTLYGKLGVSVENGGASYDKIAELRAEYDALNAEHTDFKTQIAEAITNKGIPTASDATVETMAQNIANISGSGNFNITVSATGYSHGSYTTSGGSKYKAGVALEITVTDAEGNVIATKSVPTTYGSSSTYHVNNGWSGTVNKNVTETIEVTM